MGIYKETIRKYMVGHQMRQVVSNNGVLDLAQFYLDATAAGATVDAATFEAELNDLPDIVKADASFVLSPGIYKEGRVYGINGSTKSLIEFNFARLSQATYWDKNRTLQIAAPNMPRIDYNPLNGFCNGYLLEGVKTNLVPNSQITDISTWTNVAGVGIIDLSWTRGAIFQKGFRFSDSTATNIFAYINYQLEVNKTYTFSAFLRTAGNTPPTFGSSERDSPLNDLNIYMNGFTDPTTYRVDSLGDNTYRISVTLTVSSPSAPYNVGISQRPTNNRLSFSVTGYQLELGKYPTSYIPTYGSAAVRSDDSLIAVGGNNIFRRDKGSIFVNHIMQMDQEIAQDYLYIGSASGRFCTPSGNRYRAYDGTSLVQAPEGSFSGGIRAILSTSYGAAGLRIKAKGSNGNFPIATSQFDGEFGESGDFFVFLPNSSRGNTDVKIKALAGFDRQLTTEEHQLIS